MASSATLDELSPTWRQDAEAELQKLYRGGRRQSELALRMYGQDQALQALPQTSPYSLDDICRED
jgi:hypothetical protein